MNKTVWRASTASQHEIKCVASPSLPQLFIHNAVRTPCCSGPSTSSLLSSPRRVRRLYHWCLPAVEQQDGTCIHDGDNSWSRPSAPAARSGELSPGPQVFGDKHVAYLIPCPLHPHCLYTFPVQAIYWTRRRGGLVAPHELLISRRWAPANRHPTVQPK